MSGQSPQSLFDAMPCPQCGSRELRQEIRQTEAVHVDESGDMEYIEPVGNPDVLWLACVECDERVWEK